jgi:hypothetical protein
MPVADGQVRRFFTDCGFDGAHGGVRRILARKARRRDQYGDLWWALRSNGIADRRDGFGTLLRDY